MKKLTAKLTLLFVLVALLVTGVVLSASAANKTGNSRATGNSFNGTFFSGTRSDGYKVWGSENVTQFYSKIYSQTSSTMKYWPTYDEDGAKTAPPS